MNFTWGLLGPEQLATTRRTRTLGIASTVRSFNELAVPGIGGIWYGKRFLLAMLGVVAAEQARERGAHVQNIEVANAVEALACVLAYRGNRWQRDARLRGRTKLLGRSDGLEFRRVKQRSFYVSQPMRMASTQALSDLGFVARDTARFNAFKSSELGRAFVEAALADYSPFRRTAVDHIVRWVCGQDDRSVDTDSLRGALSPLEPMSAAAWRLLRSVLEHGSVGEPARHWQRRRDVLRWVAGMSAGAQPSWTRPHEVTQNDHWDDLVAGSAFFELRDKAIAALNAVESYMGRERRKVPLAQAAACATRPLQALAQAALHFRGLKHSRLDDDDAMAFCRECSLGDPQEVLRNLIERDGRVLRIVAGEVCPAGPAFQGVVIAEPLASVTDSDDDALAGSAPVPPGISYRVRNLFLLNLDMQGGLGTWLAQQQEADFEA